VVTARACALSEVIVVIGGLEQEHECICAVHISGEGVSGAGHIVAAGAGAMAVVAYWAILSIDVFATWVIHAFAVVADAEVAGIAWVVVVVVFAVAAVTVADAGVLAFVVRCLVFDAVGVIVVDLGNLHLLWLHYQGCIAVSKS